MPLRSVRNWSAYLGKTLSEKRILEKVMKKIKTPGLKNAVKDAVRERQEIMRRIIVGTALNIAGAKQLAPPQIPFSEKKR